MRKINPSLLNAGMYLATPLLLGVFLGYQLDRYFHTAPFWMIAFILFGTVSSFYNLWKLSKETLNDRS
ncbi:MAG: AtpZ/AtpI family protein [Microgenomates group bacterium]|jgi:F0F1-type ATP synthase assembly protein I|nr:AtpZ/AtpI family protein [Candidatus Woesebacteria bacterium]MBP6883375.1 AtpZ/AtpI family protein [Candidatus Woesebacteria bacterium]QQR64374.1 MAG: AtpZ/AtpI family protein [Candidatus Roizmanbacteria bacterium]